MKKGLEPGKTPDELNAGKFEKYENEIVSPPLFWFEDEIKGLNLAASIKDILAGKVAYFKFAAGEASRLIKSFIRAGIIPEKDKNNPEVLAQYRMWNIRLWEVADKVRNNLNVLKEDKQNLETKRSNLDITAAGYEAELKELSEEIEDLKVIIEGFTSPRIAALDRENPSFAANMKLGVRHLMALKLGIMQAADSIGEDPVHALDKVRLILSVTNSLASDVIADLKELNNKDTLGFNINNIMLVVNDNIPGYLVDFDKNGKPLLHEIPIIKTERGEVLNNPNPNHGFNIIYADTPSAEGIFHYSKKSQDFVRVNASAFDYLYSDGVETIAIHRTNDMNMLIPQYSVDIGFYGLYKELRRRYGINHLLEVLNNFTGEKGGLAFSTQELREGKLMMLAEGLAVKTSKAKAMLDKLRKDVQKNYNLKDIPYNRMYHYINLKELPIDLEDPSNIIFSSDGNLWISGEIGLFLCRLNNQRWDYIVDNDGQHC